MQTPTSTTLPNGNKVILLEEVDSTNVFAANHVLIEKLEEATVIVAKNQSSGKGQKGTKWESEPGKNLTFSIIYYPEFLLISDQFMLSKIVALSVLQTIKKAVNTDAIIKIKWPNDIYVNNDKIAGILIENSIQNTKLRQSIIGVGINVNQHHFKSEINACSIINFTKKELDLMSILNEFCASLNNFYTQLKAGSWDSINKLYRDHLYQIGEWKSYQWKDEKIEAKITGVNPQGKLTFQLKNDEIGTADLKEIIFLREP